MILVEYVDVDLFFKYQRYTTLAYYAVNVLFTFLFITKPVPNISIFKLITHGLLQDFRKVKSLDYQKYAAVAHLEEWKEEEAN
mgnify:CR=1 FL=1